jgi:hypothetical protein
MTLKAASAICSWRLVLFVVLVEWFMLFVNINSRRILRGNRDAAFDLRQVFNKLEKKPLAVLLSELP